MCTKCAIFISPTAYLDGFEHVTIYKLLDVLHWLPIRQRIDIVVYLVWRCQLGLAPAYLIDLCRPVSGPKVADSFVLLRGVFWLARTAAMQNRAFSVVGARVWNDLPQELPLFPRLCTDTFLGHLKTYLFVRTGVGSASE